MNTKVKDTIGYATSADIYKQVASYMAQPESSNAKQSPYCMKCTTEDRMSRTEYGYCCFGCKNQIDNLGQPWLGSSAWRDKNREGLKSMDTKRLELMRKS